MNNDAVRKIFPHYNPPKIEEDYEKNEVFDWILQLIAGDETGQLSKRLKQWFAEREYEKLQQQDETIYALLDDYEVDPMTAEQLKAQRMRAASQNVRKSLR